jgi:hypothetical protein
MFSNCAIEATFVGYSSTLKALKFWIYAGKKSLLSSDVIFCEDELRKNNSENNTESFLEQEFPISTSNPSFIIKFLKQTIAHDVVSSDTNNITIAENKVNPEINSKKNVQHNTTEYHEDICPPEDITKHLFIAAEAQNLIVLKQALSGNKS